MEAGQMRLGVGYQLCSTPRLDQLVNSSTRQLTAIGKRAKRLPAPPPPPNQPTNGTHTHAATTQDMAARASGYSSPLPSPSLRSRTSARPGAGPPGPDEFGHDVCREDGQHAHDYDCHEDQEDDRETRNSEHQDQDAQCHLETNTYAKPEDDHHGDGAIPEDPTYILEFSLGIPHLPDRQTVHLYFEPTWIPQPLVSICFRGPPDNAFVCPPTQQTDAQDNDAQDHDYAASYAAPFIFTFAPVDLDDQLGPSIEYVTKPPNPRFVWYMMASFALGIIVSMAWSTLASSVTSSKAWVSLKQPDSTLEFNGTLIAVAEGVFNATLLLEQPWESLPAPDNRAHFCTVISSFTSETMGLCAWKDHLPDRPDVHQLCLDFSRANTDMHGACPPRSQFHDTKRAVGTILRDIAGGLERLIKLNKEDFGDDGGHDGHGNHVEKAAYSTQSTLTTRATRLLRRSRDATVANFILFTLQAWREGNFAVLQAKIAEQERALSVIVSKAEYISQGFEYELKRRVGGFVGQAFPLPYSVYHCRALTYP